MERKTLEIYQRISTEPAKIGCPEECTTWIYKAGVEPMHANAMKTAALFVQKRPNPVNLWIALHSGKVEVQQEVEVYDFGSIVGSVGGSLGLFVGFSVLQCLLDFYDKIEAKLSKPWLAKKRNILYK